MRPISPVQPWTPRAWLVGTSFLAASFVLALLLAPTVVIAEEKKDDAKKGAKAEEKDDNAKDEKADAKAPPAKEPTQAARTPLLPDILKEIKPYKSLIEAARQYFDLDEEQWKGRTALVAELEQHAAEGRYFLKDMEALRWLVYQGRSFEAQLTDRKWQKAFGVTEKKGLAGTLNWIKSEDLTLNFSIPKSYPKKDKDLRNKIPRGDPYPLLISLHEKRDYNDKYPGQALLKRRYPTKAWPELYENWIVMCPIAAAGNFVDKKGGMRDKVFRNPFAEFWRHYNIDFERIVLDGSEQAFVAATSMPVYFSGVILNGKWKLDDEQALLVKNFATLPTYVVNNPALAKQLREAGHEAVTAGVGGATLKTWMAERKRVPPTKFSWTVAPDRYDQVLAYWVNLDGTNWGAPKRQLDVDVVDTATEPNTIKIKALGINSLSLFLNDDVVDLDRKVRILINGHIEHDGIIKPQDERMEKVGRDFDFLFNREPVRIRVSMFFGWLTPARVVSLTVRPPRKVEPKKDDPKKAAVVRATPEEENRADRLWEKGNKLYGVGKLKPACSALKNLLKLPLNKHTDAATALHDKIMKELGFDVPDKGPDKVDDVGKKAGKKSDEDKDK